MEGMVIGIKMAATLQGINLERAVSGACGVTMKKMAEEEGHAPYKVLKFEQACKFCVETGAASAAKSEISGDRFFTARSIAAAIWWCFATVWEAGKPRVGRAALLYR